MSLMSDATSVNGTLDRPRWLVLGVIGLAQLMVVLDPPSEIVLAGVSAGAGLAVATLVNARDPRAAAAGRDVGHVAVCRSDPDRGHRPDHGGAAGLTRDQRESEGPSRGESAAGAFAGSQGSRGGDHSQGEDLSRSDQCGAGH